MDDLFGQYRYKVDAKGRLSLPAQFRKSLPEGTEMAVVSDLKNGKLMVYTRDTFKAWKEALFEKRGGFNPNDRTHVALATALNASTMPGAVDGAGRISLSKDQRESIGIDKDVTVIGNTDHFEVWDTQRWEDFQSSIDLDDLLFG